jgi:hypothetical protein
MVFCGEAAFIKIARAIVLNGLRPFFVFFPLRLL